MEASYKKQLGILLIIVLGIIYFQVIIGGTTRLTGSGLSITDWKIVTGTFPPISDEAWNVEFDQYKATPQYTEINKGMSMSDFKFIYFWEWLHRVWGRFGFLVLLGIFAFMLIKKRLARSDIWKFLLLLFLYAAQGLLGWYMVKSGLVNQPAVSHYRLTAHLSLAILVFILILWWVVDLMVPKEGLVEHPKLRRGAWVLVVLTFIQIIFGGFMSGLRAATHYPTFPDMNGQMVPDHLFRLSPFYQNFLENITTIQFTHRGLAYLLFFAILFFWYKAKSLGDNRPYLDFGLTALPIVLVTQVGLGITTVLTAHGTVAVGWGVAHQAVGLLLLSTLLFVTFQIKKSKA